MYQTVVNLKCNYCPDGIIKFGKVGARQRYRCKSCKRTQLHDYLKYAYDADGTLIRKQAFDNNTLGTTTDYIDGFVYVNSTLSYFSMLEGRVLYNGTTFTQEFIISDQQGNARVSFQDRGSGVAVVKQENSYYGLSSINCTMSMK